MKKSTIMLTILIFSGLILTACTDNRHLNVDPTVINMDGINTEYDEFNTAVFPSNKFQLAAAGPPTYYFQKGIIFSCNSASKGKQFDINYAKINLLISSEEYEDLSDTDIKDYFYFHILEESTPFLGNRLNSEYNEYGPFIINTESEYYYIDNEPLESNIIYTFGSDREGQFDIYFYTEGEGLNAFAGNSLFDDYYLTYHRASHTIYYCSNKDGVFNIYSYNDDAISDVRELLESPLEAEQVDILNSAGNDKCPYVFENIMVFVSDRDSVDGKFDIYFSKFDGDNWSVPRKLPGRIDPVSSDSFNYLNTEYTEYRPAIFKRYFRNDKRISDNIVMIFSSDRPGGQGGFDLYLAVLPLDIFK